jgi:VWFA-related protein
MIRVLSAILVAVVLAAAQAGETQSITVNVDLVNVYFTVCNKQGRLIPNLARERFTVYEDDNPQVITHFSRETEGPMTIGLLIDTSGSVRYKLDFEQDAAMEFLNSTLRPELDQATVVTFDSTVDVRQDLTDDVPLLANAVRRTRSGGGTRLYDALYFLVTGKITGRDGKRAIVVLTDGDDNSSRRSAAEVVEAAQRNNVAIYAINVNSVGLQLFPESPNDGTLERVAAESGGKAFFPTSSKAVASYFQTIRKELRTQYTIAYHSTNSQKDGTYRKIRIAVNDPHYSVQSRAGYYAPAVTDRGLAAGYAVPNNFPR